MTAATEAIEPSLGEIPGEALEGCSPPSATSLGIKKGRIIAREEFCWHGLALHLGRRKKPVLVLVPDATYPHLFSIQYPDGWTSSLANLSRAKDAAYGHARYLLQTLPDLHHDWEAR